MKKILIIAIGIFTMAFSYAQDITDAVRYSDDNIKGTARYRAMGGAFGALGGDLSATTINPAGAAFFNTSYGSFTLGYSNSRTKSNYFGTTNSDNESNFDIDQAGAAFVFKNHNTNSSARKFVISINYERSKNFEDQFFASGVNNSSIDSYFLDYAQGLRLDEISAFDGESYTFAYGEIGAFYGYGNQQAFLGYESYILEPDTYDDNNTNYTSNIAPGSFNHQYSHYTSGANNKVSFNAAMKFNDNLYFGLNLNTHFVDYQRSTFLFESNNNPGSYVTEVGFENNLSTYGSGFSFQLGGIFKLNNVVRIGLAYDSPTWYDMNDETTQYIAAVRNESGEQITQIINPRIVNVFAGYKIQTPDKFTGSLAFVFGSNGLISFDYSRKNYGNTKFKPTHDSYFRDLNNDISQTLTGANTFRIGGEYRHQQLSFRGGYRLEESPYKNTSFYGDLNGFSVGLGYNFGVMKIDLAYENTQRKYKQQLYQVGLTDTVSLNNKNDFISMTLSTSF